MSYNWRVIKEKYKFWLSYNYPHITLFHMNNSCCFICSVNNNYWFKIRLNVTIYVHITKLHKSPNTCGWSDKCLYNCFLVSVVQFLELMLLTIYWKNVHNFQNCPNTIFFAFLCLKHKEPLDLFLGFKTENFQRLLTITSIICEIGTKKFLLTEENPV
jgi:hypothetical protein